MTTAKAIRIQARGALALAYGILALVHLTLNALGWPIPEWVLKPVFMPLLLAYTLVGPTGLAPGLMFRLRGALVFCWLGDVILMIDPANTLLFILGLAFFLGGHGWYIAVFLASRGRNRPSSVARVQRRAAPVYVLPVAALVALGCAFLLASIWPRLGDMAIPVVAYTLVIATMALSATLRQRGTGPRDHRMVMIGALLFLLSDSFLAIFRFVAPHPLSGVVIMSLYLSGQFAMVSGLCRPRPRFAPLASGAESS